MTAIGTEVVRTEFVFHTATLKRVEYIATTYECPSCKLTENPYFIKDNNANPLVPHSYLSASLATHSINIIWSVYRRYEK